MKPGQVVVGPLGSEQQLAALLGLEQPFVQLK